MYVFNCTALEIKSLESNIFVKQLNIRQKNV